MEICFNELKKLYDIEYENKYMRKNITQLYNHNKLKQELIEKLNLLRNDETSLDFYFEEELYSMFKDKYEKLIYLLCYNTNIENIIKLYKNVSAISTKIDLSNIKLENKLDLGQIQQLINNKDINIQIIAEFIIRISFQFTYVNF